MKTEEIESKENNIPTQWVKVEEIETWVGNLSEGKGGRSRLIVNHYCGDDKEALIGQLETLIYGLKNGFDEFAC
jgi:hypothetical protein